MTTTSPRALAWPSGTSPRPHPRGYARGYVQEGGIRAGGTLDGPAYERWVAGYDVETGAPKGRLRHDKQGLRFVEVVVNGPKTWSLAAALHPEIAAAYDAAQDKAAAEIIGWLAEHATTRVGPRGRQVQVPVEQLEAAVVRHYTSRAGDPHRHLHLQINARVYAAGAWRGLHSVGVVDSIEAINGIGHAAVMCDPEFRGLLAAHGYTLDPKTGEVAQLAPYAGSFSARAAQITRNIDRYEAQWRSEHPDEEPGPTLRRAWDRRPGLRPDPTRSCPRAEPSSGSGGSTSCTSSVSLPRLSEWSTVPSPIGRVKRDAVADLVLSRLGRVARAGTPPTSAARSSGSSPPSTSWPRRRYATSWSRTSPSAPSPAAFRSWPATTYPNTSAPSPPTGCSMSRPTWLPDSRTRRAARDP